MCYDEHVTYLQLNSRQIDGETEKGRHANKQTDRQTDRQLDIHVRMYITKERQVREETQK